MSQTTVGELRERALRLHQSGNVAEAEAAYQEILKREPDDALAVHLLGVLAFQSGRPQLAVQLMNKSIAMPNPPAAFFFNFGNMLAALQENPGAVQQYRRALELQPNYPEALNNLATVHVRVSQFEEAIELFRRALQINPEYEPAKKNLVAVGG